MILYDSKAAPNARRVRIFLAEKGISVPTRPIGLGRLEQRSDGFDALNPMRQIPVLVLDDGVAISESIAICRYFEELHPAPPLFGSTALSRALIEMWQRRVELGLFANVAGVFRHTHPHMREMENPQVPEIAANSRPRVYTFLKLLDRELAGRQFIAGDAFSVADITAQVALDFMRPARLDIPPDLANLARWRAEAAARPSASA